MFIAANWIPTSNPFNLPKPPDSFLERLWAQDSELRVFASTHEPLYRLSRKQQNCQPWLKFLQQWPDTKINIEHGMWPVFSFFGARAEGFSWDAVLLELHERDQWKFRDGDVVADRLDGFELAAEQARDATIADEADQRAADMYRTYRLTTGSRVSLADRRPEGARTGERRRISRPYRPTGSGAGAIAVGR